MKTWFAVLLLVACVCVVALARPVVAPSPTGMAEDDFRKLEQNVLDAAAAPDVPALQKMLSDDFMGIPLSGDIVLSKSDVVADSGPTGNHLPKSTLHDSTVRIFGDTAVLMGMVEMQMAQKPQEIRMTTVFQKHGETWQVIAVHMSNLS